VAGVFLLRSSLCLIIKHVLHRPVNEALGFPSWEGKSCM